MLKCQKDTWYTLNLIFLGPHTIVFACDTVVTIPVAYVLALAVLVFGKNCQMMMTIHDIIKGHVPNI